MYQASEKRYQQMSYTNCGKSGLKLPAVSFGLWHNFGSNAAYDLSLIHISDGATIQIS